MVPGGAVTYWCIFLNKAGRSAYQKSRIFLEGMKCVEHRVRKKQTSGEPNKQIYKIYEVYEVTNLTDPTDPTYPTETS